MAGIRGLEVTELPGNPRIAPGGMSPEAQAWQGIRNGPMGPPAPAAPTPPSGAQAAWRSIRGAAGSFPGAAQKAFGGLPDIEGGIRRASLAATDGIEKAATGAAKGVRVVAGAGAKALTSTPIVSGVAAFAPHAGFYDDDTVPITDKFRVGIRDAGEAIGMGVGGIGGAFVGGAKAGGVGAKVGGVAGALSGGWAGSQVGRLTGADEALQRHGYDPKAGIVDAGMNTIRNINNGEGWADALRHATGPTQGIRAQGSFPGHGIPTGTNLTQPGATDALPPGIRSGPNAAGLPPGSFQPSTPAEPVNPAGTITRTGNSYTGDPGIKFGADIRGGGKGFGVSVMPSGSGGFGQGSGGPNGSAFTADSLRPNHQPQSGADDFRTLGDMRRSGGGAVSSLDGTLGGGRGAVPGELPALPNDAFAGFSSQWKTDRDRQNKETSFKSALWSIQHSNMKPRDIRHATELLNNQMLADQRIESEQKIAAQREAGETGRARYGADTQRAIAERGNDVSIRGQDITREGHFLSNKVAREQAIRETYFKERDFQTGRSDHAQLRGDKDFEQKGARETQLQRNIEAANTIMVDGKPQVDGAAASAYRSGIDRSIARMGAAGAHQLSPLDEQRLMAGSDLLKTMQANAGVLPWNPDKLKTMDPVDLTNLRVLPNGDRQITRADSKAVGQIIPKRFFDTQEGVRFFGGTPTNKYDILHGAK